MPYQQYSLDQVADYLHIARGDVERLVKDDSIPFEMRGSNPVFIRSQVDAWASQRILGLSTADLKRYHQGSSARTHDLSDDHAIMPELLKVVGMDEAMTSKTKASVIRDMVALADQTGLLIYSRELFQGVLDRERMGTTALPGGFALLHPPHHDPYFFEDSFIAVGRTIQSIPYGAVDGQTTNVFILVCCQDDRIHLHVLARLCMMCQQTDLLFQLREKETARDMLDAILESEQQVIKEL